MFSSDKNNHLYAIVQQNGRKRTVNVTLMYKIIINLLIIN